MELQEAKDQVAKKMGLSWDALRKHHSIRGMEITMGEVAELHTQSKLDDANKQIKDLEAKILQYRMKYIPDHPNRIEYDEHFGLTSEIENDEYLKVQEEHYKTFGGL